MKQFISLPKSTQGIVASAAATGSILPSAALSWHLKRKSNSFATSRSFSSSSPGFAPRQQRHFSTAPLSHQTALFSRVHSFHNNNKAFPISQTMRNQLLKLVNTQQQQRNHHYISFQKRQFHARYSLLLEQHHKGGKKKHPVHKRKPSSNKEDGKPSENYIQHDPFIPTSALLENKEHVLKHGANADVASVLASAAKDGANVGEYERPEVNPMVSSVLQQNSSQKAAPSSLHAPTDPLMGNTADGPSASLAVGGESGKHSHLENKFTPANLVPSPFIDSSMASTIASVTLDDILRARQVQLTLLKNTPLQKSIHLSDAAPGNNQVYLKFESAHLTGSFKERGAIYKLASLTPEEKKRGVVAASAGNHAQAVSYHAFRLGIKATIVMPELTPLAKVEGTKKWGAEVVLHGDSLFASLQKANEICEAEDRVFVHPYNDDKIIAGQGTLGIELMEQNPFLDAVIIPIGGGGLIAGTAMALKQVNPRIKIYGVEASNMPGMKLSMEQKKVVDVPFIRTLADGIAVRSIGDKPLSIVSDYVDDVVTVSENEIAAAVMTLLEKEKTMTEGAGACAVAALLTEKLKLQNKRVCCVLTGGNIDVSVLREIIDRGLVSSGRLARVRITVPDAPGYLAKVLTLMATLGCNVSEVEHERAFLNLVGSVSIYVTIQTRGLEHIEQIKHSLKEHGYHHRFVSQFDDTDDQ